MPEVGGAEALAEALGKGSKLTTLLLSDVRLDYGKSWSVLRPYFHTKCGLQVRVPQAYAPPTYPSVFWTPAHGGPPRVLNRPLRAKNKSAGRILKALDPGCGRKIPAI